MSARARGRGILVALTLAAAALAPGSGAAASGGAGLGGVEPVGGPRFGVGETVVRFSDPTRLVKFPHHAPVPRQLVTVIRYPAAGDPSLLDAPGAAPARASGEFPLIVFAHGFDVTPAPYAQLLRAWASAGYVVAAPIFPLTNANTPGGADESDLVNQPRDMTVVINGMLAASSAATGLLSGVIDPAEIAVAGQSDGGSTALATAYNRHDVDRRVGAAVILSGARIPGLRGYDFQAPAPPLLAVQGTADDINFPSSTYQYFRMASRPKFLLSLIGAPHLGPYTDEQPQLGIVERETVAFLDRFLKHVATAKARMWAAGDVPHLARLTGHA